MTVQRLCSKTACGRAASCTLTYNYAESTIVLGPLARTAEPHSYDMCADHANRLTAPRGWEVVRLVDEFPEPPPLPDDLVAIAEAVRPTRAQPAPARDPRAVVADASAAELLGRIRSTDRSAVSSVDVGRTSHLTLVRAAQHDDAVDDAPGGSQDDAQDHAGQGAAEATGPVGASHLRKDDA